MKKIIVKRKYSISQGQQYDFTNYIYSPLQANGSESETPDIEKAYKFSLDEFYITSQVYANGKGGDDSYKDGVFEYMQELVEIDVITSVKDYAIECHRSTNHKYDKNKPYEVHLQMVYDTAVKFISLIPKEAQEMVLDACWVHDVIEDCRQTYNDVKSNTSEGIAELAYALTNEKGKNRKERGNHKYYYDMRQVPYACFVKLCDRIANYKYSYKNGSRMAGMYEKEQEHFAAQFPLDGINDILIEYLNVLMRTKN